MNKNISIRTICFVGMFAAITSVLSIITIPTPWGVPFTLQTFAIALSGYVLGKIYGTFATLIYIILGLIGVPVYAGMSAGAGVLAGPTGGYLWGFIIMTFFCGLAADFGNNAKGCIAKILISILALAGCHIPGIIQLKIVAGMSWPQAALLGTVPYLLKDILSMAAAYFIAAAVRKALRSADILDWQKKNGCINKSCI